MENVSKINRKGLKKINQQMIADRIINHLKYTKNNYFLSNNIQSTSNNSHQQITLGQSYIKITKNVEQHRSMN